MDLLNSPSGLVHRVRRWPRRLVISLAVVALVLVGARIALPFVVKKQINARLAAIPGYGGSVEAVGISLVRGAYRLERIGIFKIDGAARDPFFSAQDIDFSIAWRELFRGRMVSDIYVQKPELTFVAAGDASQKDLDRRWQEVIQDLFPLEITHLEVSEGMVRYQDLTKEPHVDVFIKNMHATAIGLRNRREESGEEFPAEILIEGDTIGGGKLRLFIAAEPLAEQPHFHLSATVDGVNLPDLNESMRAIANVDVSRGTFRLAAEMAGNDGGFQGYVKPFFEDLDFDSTEDKTKGVFDRLWENIVQGLAWVVKNKPRDQLATRIPFQGRFGDPKVGLWTTIANLFRHGFIRAFNPTVEGSLRAENVLPTGESADGRNVAETKDERPPPPTGEPKLRADDRVDAPTGRTNERPKR